MSDINNLLEIAEDDKQSSYRRRQAVTDLLKNHPADQQTLRVVEKLLSGNDTSLKRDVVGAVKDSPDPKILPILKPLLAVDDDYLRRDAVQAIGRLGSREEVELVREMTSDKSFTVSYAAKTALAEIEKRVAAQEVVVEEVLEEPEPE
ncbi:MAG: HEAT repeat domain-containing protein, partial [Lentisphaeraceae bacterium]|nr:HEAT repeat domain-containing protein [Lentisphaeraceae bacterium]